MTEHARYLLDRANAFRFMGDDAGADIMFLLFCEEIRRTAK